MFTSGERGGTSIYRYLVFRVGFELLWCFPFGGGPLRCKCVSICCGLLRDVAVSVFAPCANGGGWWSVFGLG